MRDPTVSPANVASLVVALCRKATEEAVSEPSLYGADDTPGLELFLWAVWYGLLDIAMEDPSSHDRLADILSAIKAKGKEGCEALHIWGYDMDWAQLTLFGAALREYMNGPSVLGGSSYGFAPPYPAEVVAALAGDPPTDSPLSRAAAAARVHWLNLNAFVARLWELDVVEAAFYGIGTMRMELEPYSLPPERRPPSETCNPQELDVENAAVWVRIAGRRMFECREIMGPKGNPDWDRQRGAPGSSGGTWDGVDGYHPDRWAHWKATFKQISEREGRENMIEAAQAAVEAMEQVERDHASKGFTT
ncbi:hypothetical protein BD414DRAFT_142013 [Trametes punicea]|nr:hypothetical protein BD414DRAFT_142013 [Trametes punicea]